MAKGGLIGAAAVALLGGLLGELIRDVHAVALVVFIAFGAVAGAYAWGVVAYERERGTARERALEEPVAPPDAGGGEAPIRRLLRRHGASIVRFPLAPWI